MRKHNPTTNVIATCHCRAIEIRVRTPPLEVTHCNCAICRRYGVYWAYYPIGDITFSPDPLSTDTYTWNGRNVDFHRCRQCGCVTHWHPRDPARAQVGINARLFDPEILAAASKRYKDSAGTGAFH